jgi:hypothetical protein
MPSVVVYENLGKYSSLTLADGRLYDRCVEEMARSRLHVIYGKREVAPAAIGEVAARLDTLIEQANRRLVDIRRELESAF